MTDDLDAQATMMREITTEIAGRCMKHGLRPFFSIEITDQTGFTFSGLYSWNEDHSGVECRGIKYPEDASGPQMLVFPLKIHAGDHAGKTYNTTIERKH